MVEDILSQMPADVAAFLDGIADETQRADSCELTALMADASGQPPAMWGKAIVGFGSYHYRYASGREGDSCPVGFSPRKSAITIYAGCDLTAHTETLARIGKHKSGVGCLYIKRLDDIDRDVLRSFIAAAYRHVMSTQHVDVK